MTNSTDLLIFVSTDQLVDPPTLTALRGYICQVCLRLRRPGTDVHQLQARLPNQVGEIVIDSTAQLRPAVPIKASIFQPQMEQMERFV